MALGGFGGGRGILAGTAHVDIRPNLSNFGPRLKTELGGLLKSVGAFNLDTIDKSLLGVGAAASKIGGTLTKGITVPLLGAAAIATKFGADFESVLTRMQSLAGVGADEIDGIRAALLALARETGRAPTDLANALYLVRSAGLAGQQALEAVEVAAKGSAIGMGDTTTIASALVSTMNAYAKTGLTAARAGDIFTAAVREGSAEASDFAGVIGTVAPLAAQMGSRLEDVAASIAVMTNVGIDPATAATNLNAIFSGLLLASKGGSQADKALRAVGLTAEGLRDDLAKPGGILVVLRKISDAFGGDEAAIQQVFPEIRALRGLFGLLAQDGDKVDGMFGRVTDSTGDMAAGVANLAKDVKFKMERAFASAKVALIELGTGVAPVAAGLADIAAQGFGLFADLPAPIRNTAVAFLGVAAAAGPVAFGLGKVASLAGKIASFTGVRSGLDSFRLGMMGASDATAGFANKLGVLSGGSGTAATAIRGLGRVAVFTAGALGGLFVLSKLGIIAEHAGPKLDDVARAVQRLGKTGMVTGEISKLFGDDLGKIGVQIDRLGDQSGWDKAGRAAEHFNDTVENTAHKVPLLGRLVTASDREGLTAEKQINALDTALTNLANNGQAAEAAAAFEIIKQKALEQGVSIEVINRAFNDYVPAAAAARKAGEDTGDGLKDLTEDVVDTRTEIEKLVDATLAARRARLDTAEGVQRFVDAETTLADARADAAGKGDRATAAAEREQDALRGLADAAESAADAQNELRDARKALADFESGTSATIRDLERQQILERVVTTPEEVRQKQIDLLKFDQDAASERERLQGSVADAEQGVADAADKVAEAQQRVVEAAQERKQIQLEAAERVKQAEREVESAALDVADALALADSNQEPLEPWIRALTRIAEMLEPGSKLRTDLTSFLADVAGTQPGGDGRAGDEFGRGARGSTGHRARGGALAEGWTVVGEEGPELARKSGTSVDIYSNPQSRAMGAAHIDARMENHFHGSGIPTERELDVLARKQGRRLARMGRRA